MVGLCCLRASGSQQGTQIAVNEVPRKQGCFKRIGKSVAKRAGFAASSLVSYTWGIPSKVVGSVVSKVGSYVATNLAIQAFAIGALYGYLGKGLAIEDNPEVQKNILEKCADFIQLSVEGAKKGGAEVLIQGVRDNYTAVASATGVVSGFFFGNTGLVPRFLPFSNLINSIANTAIGLGIGYVSGSIVDEYVLPNLSKNVAVTELFSSIGDQFGSGIYGGAAAGTAGAVVAYLGVKVMSIASQSVINKTWAFTGCCVVRGVTGSVKLLRAASSAIVNRGHSNEVNLRTDEGASSIVPYVAPTLPLQIQATALVSQPSETDEQYFERVVTELD
jgi:hypothetical protein